LANPCPRCQTDNPRDSKFCKECATPLPGAGEALPTRTLEGSTEELKRGTVFAGRYEIIEELGQGGMGRVYRAEDRKVREEVALKLIKPEIAADKKVIERFTQELRTARKIGHRNVGRMYDIGEDRGSHYITMEYVSGQDLKGLIRQSKRLSVQTALSIAREVCAGLAEAHRLGIVHRDLKPSNIMIDREGAARIMDFGIARTVKGTGLTGSGVMIGTPEYMSPEQVEAKDVDQRSDIYSLGIILYEMLTGMPPFEADSPFAVGIKQKSETPQDPREVNPQIPADLGAVILKCLEKDKKDRYQAVAHLESELERIERGLPKSRLAPAPKKPLTSREITVKFSLKKIALPGTVVIALAAAAILLLTLIPKKKAPVRPKIENSIAVVSFKNQTGDPAYDYLQEVIPNLLITNLENTGLFYVTTWERMRDILKQMGVKPEGVIDSDLGFELCRREGIQAVAIGAFSKAGEVFIMDVKVLDAETKRTIKSSNTRGVGADSIFGSQIDDLSREISLGLGAGMDKVAAARLDIKGITTHSLDAYRYFLKGKDACNLLAWTEARDNLNKALEIDPAFGLAYVYLAWTYVDTGPDEAIAETLKKAKTLSDKSSQKDALYLDGLHAYFVEKDTPKAVQRIDELLRRYPDEKWAFHISGDFVRKDGDLEGATGRYQKWLELDPQDSNALYHLSNVSLMMGNLEKAEEYIKRHEAVASPDINNLRLQALIYVRLGQVDNAIAKHQKVNELRPELPQATIAYLFSIKEDYDEAMKWADLSVSRARSPDGKAGAFNYRGDIRMLKGALGDALADYDRAAEAVRTESSLEKAWALEGKGFVHRARGEYEAARKSLEGMRAAFTEYSKILSPEDEIEWAFDMGMLALAQGQIGQAKARLSEIGSLLSEVVKEQQPDYHLRHELLQGEMLLVQGRLDEALACAKKACGPDSPYWRRGGAIFIAQSYSLDLAARIYGRKGDTGQAISEYERLLGTNFSTGFMFPVHPLYRYRLGLLYEKANDTQKAKSQLERFLFLWKDADAGAAEIEDAKKRLSGLS